MAAVISAGSKVVGRQADAEPGLVDLLGVVALS